MRKETMDSLVTVLAAVEKLGFQSQFEVSGQNLISLKTKKQFLPSEVKIVHYYRFEGASNPDDSSIMYAIETNSGEKGTLVNGYGVSANSDTGNFMQNVENIQK